MTREHGHDEITQDGCVKVHGGDHEEEKREDIELLSVEGELFSAPVVYPVGGGNTSDSILLISHCHLLLFYSLTNILILGSLPRLLLAGKTLRN